MNYWSPSWNGFSVRGSYSAGQEHTGLALSPLKLRLYGASAEYRSGPLYVGLGYAQHQDFNPAGAAVGPAAGQYNGGDDTNFSLVGVYTFGGTIRLSGVYSKSEYDVTNGTSMDVDGWAAYVDWKLSGPHTVRAQYGQVDDPSGNATVSLGRYRTSAMAGGLSTGAKVFGVNYEYASRVQYRWELPLLQVFPGIFSLSHAGAHGQNAHSNQPTIKRLTIRREKICVVRFRSV